MRESDIKRTIEGIKASDDMKDSIWNRVNDKNNIQKNPLYGERMHAVKWLAASALICLIAFPSIVFASDIKGLFLGWLNKDTNVEEYVINDIFEDADGHVKFTVKEMLSDVMNLKMTVCYEALDKEGESWINNFDFYGAANNIGKIYFDVSPKIESNGVNSLIICEELDNYRTETERYFVLGYEASSMDYESDKAVLNYPMSQNIFNKAEIDISTRLKPYTYDLKALPETDKLYMPIRVFISKIGMSIYAKDMGIYKQSYSEETAITSATANANMDSATLIFKNGEKWDILDTLAFRKTMIKEEDGADLVLCSGAFITTANGIREFHTINPEDIIAIEIDGITYQLKN